jgi:hypothetical protein
MRAIAGHRTNNSNSRPLRREWACFSLFQVCQAGAFFIPRDGDQQFYYPAPGTSTSK